MGHHDLRPHLSVVLDLEPKAGLGRFTERDRIEGQPLEFHHRVRARFLDLAAAEPRALSAVLDAKESIEVLATAIRQRVEALLA